MTNVGSADWLRGIVTAQRVIGTAPPSTSNLIVTLPPSCETILIVGDVAIEVLRVNGDTTGGQYPVLPYSILGPAGAYVWIAAVSEPVDPVITITLSVPPATAWYVISDQGIRLTTDTTLPSLIATTGQPVPTIGLLAMGENNTAKAEPLQLDVNDYLLVTDATSPYSPVTAKDYGPPINPVAVSINITGAGSHAFVAGVPGHRLRLLSAYIEYQGGDPNGYYGVLIQDSALTVGFLACESGESNSLNYSPGTVLATGDGFVVNLPSSAGGYQVIAGITYDQPV